MEATSVPRGRALMLPRRLLAALGDERLVDQLRHGNAIAFEVMYDRHHRGILAYCRHLLGSREEAEDAVQQTFVAAHADLVGGDRQINLKPWLYTIARNRCLSVLRARREYAAELHDADTAGLADDVQQRADLRELLDDLRELPEPQRAALVLSEVADLAHAEIAEILGVDVAKVKSLVFQARSGLIERRQARETPCEEIREQLATLRGGSLRRGPLRRHLKSCPGCAAYRDEVRQQRRMLAVALPVIPSAGLRESALAAVGLGGTAGAAGVASGSLAGGAAVSGAAAGAAAGGGAASSAGGLGAAMGALAAKAGAAKVALAVVAGTAAVGGGAVAVTQDGGSAAVDRPPAQGQSAPASGEGPAPAAGEAPAGGPAPAAPVPGGDAEDEDARRGRDGSVDEDDPAERRSSDGRPPAEDRGQARLRGRGGDASGRARGRGRQNGNRQRQPTRRQRRAPESRTQSPGRRTPPRRSEPPPQVRQPETREQRSQPGQRRPEPELDPELRLLP